jgi:hypothetical protein
MRAAPAQAAVILSGMHAASSDWIDHGISVVKHLKKSSSLRYNPTRLVVPGKKWTGSCASALQHRQADGHPG